MFGIKFIKVEPTDYLLLYKNGEIKKEGTGLSMFYFAPTSSLVRIPLASVELPFIFSEVTSDFQTVSIQGQLTYRIEDPKKISSFMNFTLVPDGREYISNDPLKLPQRLVNNVQVTAGNLIRQMPLKKALISTEDLVTKIKTSLKTNETITSLGIEILGLSIIAIKPTPETSKALEAEAREEILKKADEAIYARRNSAVEQERAIKENELNTEIAVENKKRQIRETQMDAEMAVQQKQRELQEAQMNASIILEEQNKTLVTLASENKRQEADTKAYSISTAMKAISEVDAKTLQALASVGMDPGQLIAIAFKEIAESAEKIGQLNISPDLLQELMNTPRGK